jgi:uncharacterized membrane protein (UPF0136 family)
LTDVVFIGAGLSVLAWRAFLQRRAFLRDSLVATGVIVALTVGVTRSVTSRKFVFELAASLRGIAGGLQHRGTESVLDHACEVATVYVGAWRFLLSPVYRRKKLDEWRGARETLSGNLTMAVEILAAVAVGAPRCGWSSSLPETGRG